MKYRVPQRKVARRHELLDRNLDAAAARIQGREEYVRRKSQYFRTRVEKCIVAEGGIFERLLWTATNL